MAVWYPEACRWLGLEHRILIREYRNLIERAIQMVKDRTEAFDDHFPCRRRSCRLSHIQNWLTLSNLHKQPEHHTLITLIKEVITLK